MQVDRSCQSRGRQGMNKWIYWGHTLGSARSCRVCFFLAIFMNGNWFRFKLKLIVCRCGSDWLAIALRALDNRRSPLRRCWAFNVSVFGSSSFSMFFRSSHCRLSRSSHSQPTETAARPETAIFQWHRRIWRIYQNEIFIISPDYERLGFVYSGSFKLQPSVGTPKPAPTFQLHFTGALEGENIFSTTKLLVIFERIYFTL